MGGEEIAEFIVYAILGVLVVLISALYHWVRLNQVLRFAVGVAPDQIPPPAPV